MCSATAALAVLVLCAAIVSWTPESYRQAPQRPSTPSVPAGGTLLSVDWRWRLLLDPADRLVLDVSTNGVFSVILLPDGSLRLSTICGRTLGRYTVDGRRLSMKLSQRMSDTCRELDAAPQQFEQLIDQVEAYTLDERGLVLHLRRGAGVMIFSALA